MQYIYLGNEVQIGYKCRLKNNRHVGGIEKLNWVRALLSTGIFRSHRQHHSKTLEIDHDEEHQYCSKKISHIWKVLSVKCLPECTDFVRSGYKQME